MRFLSKFLLISLLILSTLEISARPAKPGLIVTAQPDGMELNIKLSGDFHNRLVLTEDGYPLIAAEDGYYHYAVIDKNGEAMPSGVRALNPGKRTIADKKLIQSIDKAAVISTIETAQISKSGLSTRADGLVGKDFPTSGKQKGIAILVEFQNLGFTIENPRQYFHDLLNKEGFSEYEATGSARDYYILNSGGIFEPEFDIYGPVKLSNNYNYYGTMNDMRAYEMVPEACALIEDDVDFSQYDRNNDGVVDNIYIFYAGYGEADGGGPATVWPHSWDLSEATSTRYYVDGLLLEHYACSNELQHSDDTPDGIGSFCHEFSHVLGLPDLYSTAFSTAFTPNYWSIMDIGSYCNNSRTPPNFSSYERMELGWIEPQTLKEGTLSLDNLADSNVAYILKGSNKNEYYLFENRQQKGNDTYLPSHGMIVWHIDYDEKAWSENDVNNNASHQRVDLIEADNIFSGATLEGDPFPGSDGVTSFTCETKPAFVFWTGEPSEFEITDIAESSEGLISFNVSYCAYSGVEEIEFPEYTYTINGQSYRLNSPGIEIFDIAGRKVAALPSSSSLTLPAGFYILFSPTQTLKIQAR